jgi:hypothetical protein
VRGTRQAAVSGTALAVIALLWPEAALAYRPFDSTDAAVARYGTAEVEIGPGYWAEASARAIVAPRTVLNLGVLPRVELVLEGIGRYPIGENHSSGRYQLADTGLFVKTLLLEGSLQDASGPSIATEVGMLLPTVRAEPGIGASVAVIVSERWDLLTVHLNGQALRTRAEDLGLFGGVIVEGPERLRVRPVAEVYLAKESGLAHAASGLVGAIWRLSESVSFDAAFRAALHDGFDEYEVRVGLTWDVPLWSHA